MFAHNSFNSGCETSKASLHYSHSPLSSVNPSPSVTISPREPSVISSQSSVLEIIRLDIFQRNSSS